MTTKLDLDKLESAAKAASPLPWELVDYRHGDASAETWLGILRGAVEIHAERFQVAGIKYSSLPTEENWANGHYIVAACNAVPELVKELRRQAEENRILHGLIKLADKATQARYAAAMKLHAELSPPTPTRSQQRREQKG